MTASELARRRVAELGEAVALLTRLPVSRRFLGDMTEASARAAWAFPIVGAAVGAIGGIVYAVLHRLGCSPALASLWTLGAMVLATGALHEDGLADSADGLAGKTREQRLAIMRDHHIGTYGALALALSLFIRAMAITAFARPSLVVAALIATGALSRAGAAMLMAALPHARSDGLSVSVGRPALADAGIALVIAIVIAFIVLPATGAVIAALATALGVCAVGIYTARTLQGQTGDVLGASCQLSECLALTGLACLLA